MDGIGLGRGSIRRYTSDPGFVPFRRFSSSPASVCTPPPPGTSPHPRSTPDGVLTQVQRKKVAQSPGADSNSTDALFDDGFDFNDVEIPESGLSQSFPKCRLNESNANSGQKEDLLSKVINQTISLNSRVEERPIASQNELFIKTIFPEDTSTWYPYMLRKVDGGAEFDAVKEVSPAAALGYRDAPSISGSVGSNGSKRSSSSSSSSQASSPKGRKFGRDERDGQRFSDDPDFDQDSSSSTHLSPERIQRMLKNLNPIIAPGRFNNDANDASKDEPTNGKVVPISTVNEESSWGNQIPVRYDTEQEGEVLVPVANGPDRGRGSMKPSDFSLEISTAVKQVRHALVKMVDGVVVGTGLEKHEFEPIHRSRVHVTDGNLDLEYDDKKTFRLTIPELMLPIRDQINVTFECGRIAKFLLVARNRYTKRWSIPSKQRFHDVLNQVDNRIRRNHVPCQFVLRWNSDWEGGIGLMGLCIIDIRALELYRKMITEIAIGDLMYNTYPKDVLNHGTEVSVYLRAELKAMDLEFIPYSLFEKNRMLAGSVAVRYSKDIAGKEDQVQSGGGKLVILEGDQDFCQSIHNYPHNHHYRLGTSSVRLRYEEYGKEFQPMGPPPPDQILRPQPPVQQPHLQPAACIQSINDSVPVSMSTSSSSSSSSSSSGSDVQLTDSRVTRAKWAGKDGGNFPPPVPAKRKI